MELLTRADSDVRNVHLTILKLRYASRETVVRKERKPKKLTAARPCFRTGGSGDNV